MRIWIVALAALPLGACATVTRGTTSQVTVSSEPSGAEVRTSIGLACPATPCTFDVNRKSEFVAVFSMPGYRSQEIPVQTRVAGGGAAGFAGNILIGGIVGMGVDAATGSTLEHFPNPVHATLVPEALPSAERRRPARARAPARQAPAAM